MDCGEALNGYLKEINVIWKSMILDKTANKPVLTNYPKMGKRYTLLHLILH